MIIAIDETDSKKSTYSRAILSRYLWKVNPNLFIWHQASIRHDILRELEAATKDFKISMFWKDSKEPLGFSFYQYGAKADKRNDLGLYVSSIPAKDKVKIGYLAEKT